MSTAALVLAAGGARRYRAAGGGEVHKLLAPLGRSAVVTLSVTAAAGASLDETIVVWGAVDLSGHVPDGVCLVHNERWSEGQATSLAAGLDRCRSAGHDAVVVGLGDTPLVPASAWSVVAACQAAVAIAEFSGRRHPPLRLARPEWDKIDRTGDAGARSLWGSHPDLVTVPCDGIAGDVDTPADLRRLSEYMRRTAGARMSCEQEPPPSSSVFGNCCRSK